MASVAWIFAPFWISFFDWSKSPSLTASNSSKFDDRTEVVGNVLTKMNFWSTLKSGIPRRILRNWDWFFKRNVEKCLTCCHAIFVELYLVGQKSR